MQRIDYQDAIEDQGYDVIYNPPGDGSCQFAALAHQLGFIGIQRSPNSLRKEIIRYLRANPLDNNGFPLIEMIPQDEFDTFEEYLENMSRGNTYGDQITLFAVANIFNVNVQIVSSLGNGAQHMFTPSTGAPFTTISLGHLAETHGEHYVSIHSRDDDHDTSINNEKEDTYIVHGFDYDGENYEQHGTEEAGGKDEMNSGKLWAEDGLQNEPDSIDERREKDELDGMEEDVKNDDQNRIDQDTDTVNNVIDGQQNVNIEEEEDTSHLNNDVFENIIKQTVNLYPYMRTSLRSVNRFFKYVVDKVPCQTIYIPELEEKVQIISMRKILKIKGQYSGAVMALKKIVNTPKWDKAWLKLKPLRLGWFVVFAVFWTAKKEK